MMRFRKIYWNMLKIILDRRDDATETLLDFAENVGFRLDVKRG
jgi:hypothetical protein